MDKLQIAAALQAFIGTRRDAFDRESEQQIAKTVAALYGAIR